MSSRLTSVFGLLLAVTGVAHFITPATFVPITRAPFPVDTEKWVPRNGACETAIGVALAVPATRKLGWAGLAGYVGWLGFNAARNA